MATTPDTPTDVGAAAERLKRMDAGEPITSVYGFVGGTVDDMAAHWNDDRIRTSEAYLDLTDPTPLTVERLVGMGFTRNGQQYSFGDIRVDHVHDGVNGFKWWMMGVQSSPLIRPKPRTAGELRQLLMRMGK